MECFRIQPASSLVISESAKLRFHPLVQQRPINNLLALSTGPVEPDIAFELLHVQPLFPSTSQSLFWGFETSKLLPHPCQSECEGFIISYRVRDGAVMGWDRWYISVWRVSCVFVFSTYLPPKTAAQGKRGSSFLWQPTHLQNRNRPTSLVLPR